MLALGIFAAIPGVHIILGDIHDKEKTRDSFLAHAIKNEVDNGYIGWPLGIIWVVPVGHVTGRRLGKRRIGRCIEVFVSMEKSNIAAAKR